MRRMIICATMFATTCFLNILATSLWAGTEQAGKASYVAIVTDRSNSIEHGDGAACMAVKTLVNAAMHKDNPFAQLYMTPTISTLTAYATGNSNHPENPIVLLPEPIKISGLEKRIDVTRDQQEKNRKATIEKSVDAVYQACCEKATPAKQSPIYSAVKEAVINLQNSISHPNPKYTDANGMLIIQSDLVENYEKPLANAITNICNAGNKTNKCKDNDSELKKKYSLDLQGKIAVYVCGISQSSDVRQEGLRENVIKFWQDNVLLNASEWIVQPTCPGYQPVTKK